MITKDDVKRIFWKWNIMDIHFYISQRRFYICGQILELRERFKSFYEAKFGGNMQHFCGCRKEVSFILEKKPQKPMSLQGQTIGAKGISSTNASIREKLPKGM
jgi:hypothetical protein